MAKRTIVVTGASSLVIKQLIDRLDPINNNIIAITRRIGIDFRKDIKWVECDLSKTSIDYLFLAKANMIIHAAAISNTHREDEYEIVNIQSTINLVNEAKRYGVAHFIYISSVFAGVGYGKYGLSKSKAERYIREHLNHFIIIRSSQLYGYSTTNPIDQLVRQIQEKLFVVCPSGDAYNIYPLHYSHFIDCVIRTISGEISQNKTLYCLGPEVFNYIGLARHISSALNRKVFILPVIKPLMLMLRVVIKTLKINIGIYPDQIYRLYQARITFDDSPKYISSINLVDYLKNHIQINKKANLTTIKKMTPE